jgi:hypothetical protein
MEKGTLDYPVSVNYRENWGAWEAVREIVQNSLDSGAQAKMSFSKGKLTVTDKGEGFGLKNLLIGESTKDGISSIGKFGEGMKFAFLVLLRINCTVKVLTNGLELKPRLKETFETETLSIDYKERKKSIQGTKVIIDGLDQDYRHNFLSLDMSKNMQDKVLLNHPGSLYIKGIYVKQIPAVAGYNLVMERENPVSGDVDMYKVRAKVANLINRTKDRDYMKLLLNLIGQDGVDEYVEAECGNSYIWDFNSKKVWKSEVKKKFGTVRVCRATHLDAAREAKYKNYRVIQEKFPFIEGFAEADLEVVRLREKKAESRVARKSLDRETKANIRWVKRLLEGAMDKVIKKFLVVEFRHSHEQNTEGKGLHGQWIKVTPSVAKDRTKLLEVSMHEMVHYLWGYGDLSQEFQRGFEKVAAQVALYLVANKGKVKRNTSKVSDKEVRREELLRKWLELAKREATKELGSDLINHTVYTNYSELQLVGRGLGLKIKGMGKYDLSHLVVKELRKRVS